MYLNYKCYKCVNRNSVAGHQVHIVFCGMAKGTTLSDKATQLLSRLNALLRRHTLLYSLNLRNSYANKRDFMKR